jgi:hypothetical protein
MIAYAPVLLLTTGVYLFLMLIMAVFFAGGLYMATRGSKQIDQGRRSFLSGRVGVEDHAQFFGLQLVIQVFGSDELRARLVRILEAEETSAQDKRRTMKSLAGLLLENQYAWEYGYWEFNPRADEAIGAFNQWRNEIEASMATEADEMGSEIDRLHRFSDQREYMIVSLILMIDNSEEPVEDDVGDVRFRPTYSQLALPFRQLIDGFDESEYFKAQTFVRLLDAARSLDPRVIERDGVYLIPGAENDGLSTTDLLGESGWKYLTDHSFRLS